MFALWREHEAHAAAGHASEHPEPPKVITEFSAHLINDAFGEKCRGPRDDGLQRAKKVTGGQSPQSAHVAGLERLQDGVEEGERLAAGVPFWSGAEQVFLGDHFQDGSDILGHAAVDEHE